NTSATKQLTHDSNRREPGEEIMLALVATSNVSREPFMGSTNRREELDWNLRVAPQSVAADLRAELPAHAPSSPVLATPMERDGCWGPFLRILLRALGAWPT